MSSKICKKCNIDKTLDHCHAHCNKQGTLIYSSACILCRRAIACTWNKANKEKHNTSQAKWRHSNKELDNQRSQLSKIKHVDSVRRCRRIRQQRIKATYGMSEKSIKYNNSISHKIKYSLRSRLYNAIKNNHNTSVIKIGSHVADLGCTIEELKIYLESKWQSGMTWGNWSFRGWHIDHVIPLSSFDLTDREQLLKACHYTNLQPLWWYDNISKSDKMPQELACQESL